MTPVAEFRALAGQSPLRVLAKAGVALLVVGLAALVAREGPALAILIVFMGVTGPAIRLVTMKMDGTYDRIIVSPVPKGRFFLKFAGLWAVAAVLPLVPAIALIMVLVGPATIVPAILGTLLAAALGTLAGVVSGGLSEAHLAALLASGLLIVFSLTKTPVAAFMPYAALSSPPSDPAALAVSAVLPALALIALALAGSRS